MQKPSDHNTKIKINIAKQQLQLFAASKNYPINTVKADDFELKRTFAVSTGLNGVGSLEGSGCTPLGKHVIAEKIGANMPINTVFVGRAATGESYNEALAQKFPKRDWILSRILWLAGIEEGVNKGFNSDGVCCDTYQRYIYIHGTPDSESMSIALSHGCIRMRNKDIIWLFDHISEGTMVDIVLN